MEFSLEDWRALSLDQKIIFAEGMVILETDPKMIEISQRILGKLRQLKAMRA